MTEQDKCPKCDGKGTLEPTEYPRCSKCGKHELMIGWPCGPAPHCNCWVLSVDFTGSYMGGFDSEDVLPLLRDVRSQLTQAKTQRDDLLAACEEALAGLTEPGVSVAGILAAAIAKAAPEEPEA